MMGGNMEGLGNITTTAEFNFFADPESAHVVINKLGKIGGPVKTTIVTYELCKRNFYTWVNDQLLHLNISIRSYTYLSPM
jgi:purine nucleosidase